MSAREAVLSRVAAANPIAADGAFPETVEATPPPLRALIEADGAPVGQSSPRRWARPGLVVAGAMAVALAVALPVLLLRDTSDVATTNPPTVVTTAPTTVVPSTTPTTVPATTVPVQVSTTALPATTTTVVPTTTTIPPMPASLEMNWIQAPTQDAFGVNDGIWQVIEGGPGLIAVGNVLDVSAQARCDAESEGRNSFSADWPCGGYVDAAVWVSSDGLQWEKVGDPAEFTGVPSQFGTEGNQVITNVVAGPGGYVAYGWVDDRTGDIDPPIWVSPDGLDWRRLRRDDPGVGDVGFDFLFVDDQGYLGLGEESAWRSVDGLTWTSTTEVGPVPLDVGGVWLVDGMFVGIGSDNIAGEFGRAWGDPFVVISADGVKWERSPLGTERGIAFNMAELDGEVVVTGHDSGGATIWRQTSSGTWERQGTIAGIGREFFPTTVAAVDDRWVVGGMEFIGTMPLGAAAVFSSADQGITWYEVAFFDRSPDGLFDGTVDQRPPGMRDLIAWGDGFIAVGGTGNRSAPVWIGTWSG